MKLAASKKQTLWGQIFYKMPVLKNFFFVVKKCRGKRVGNGKNALFFQPCLPCNLCEGYYVQPVVLQECHHTFCYTVRKIIKYLRRFLVRTLYKILNVLFLNGELHIILKLRNWRTFEFFQLLKNIYI